MTTLGHRGRRGFWQRGAQEARRGLVETRQESDSAAACLALVGSLTTVAATLSGVSTRTSQRAQRHAHYERVHVFDACHAAGHRSFREAQPWRDRSQAANVVNTPDTYVPLLQTERLAGNEPDIDETYDVLTPTLEVDGLVADLSPDLKAGKPYPQNYWLPTFVASYIPPKGAPFGVGQVFALPTKPTPRSSCTTRTSSKRLAFRSRRTVGPGPRCWPTPPS